MPTKTEAAIAKVEQILTDYQWHPNHNCRPERTGYRGVCKCCGGAMGAYIHGDTRWRQCENCGDIRPVFARAARDETALELHALINSL